MGLGNKYRQFLATLVLLAVVIMAGSSFPSENLIKLGQQPTPVQLVTAVIPNTGGNQVVTVSNGNGVLGWIMWVILGIAIIALIVALVSRGASRTDL